MYCKEINFTSGTTTAHECIAMLVHKNDKKDYRSAYHTKIKEYFGVQYAYSYAAGRMALYSILKAINVGKADEVIVQGYTCCVVPKAIMYTGAKPVYADISEKDFNLDYLSVKQNITNRTKAVIVQHTYGIPCESILKIKELCKQKGIFLIEDCAHTFGGEYQGEKLGTLGDAAFFSTDHTKYISTSVGGVVITNNVQIGERIKEAYVNTEELSKAQVRAITFQFCAVNIFKNKYIFWLTDHFKMFKICEIVFWIICDKLNLLFFMTDYSNIDAPKYNYPMKLSNVQALIGQSQLAKLDLIIDNRKQITQIYVDELSSIISLPVQNNGLLRFPVLVANPSLFIEEMKDVVKVEQWFNPILQCAKAEELEQFHYVNGSCPVAEEIAKHIINLPIHSKINKKEAQKIGARIRYLYEENK